LSGCYPQNLECGEFYKISDLISLKDFFLEEKKNVMDSKRLQRHASQMQYMDMFGG
jgi:hypothetical protein